MQGGGGWGVGTGRPCRARSGPWWTHSEEKPRSPPELLLAFRAAGGMRRGNMGHLTRIANAVAQNLERGSMQTHICEVIRGEPFLPWLPLTPTPDPHPLLQPRLLPSGPSADGNSQIAFPYGAFLQAGLGPSCQLC